MIVDTSAIIAILNEEPEHEQFFSLIQQSTRASMSAGSWIELSAVITRSVRPDFAIALDALMSELRLAIAPVTLEQASIGHAAYREFGRGTKHQAQLNFGDCFAYALAKDSGEPLLFKGDAFIHTDIAPAL